jgi:cobalt-zinc-cadmium efflux system membrane fusion protein
MNKIKFLLLVSILMAGPAVAQDDPSGHQQHAEHEQTISISEVQLDNLGIKIGALTANQKIPLLNAPGKVVIPPANEYIVSTAQAGLINKLNVSIGDKVSKGQQLATINSPGLLALQRQYLKASSDQQLAYTSFQRDRKLLKQGVISERRWQQTQTQYHGTVAEANEARQLLEISGMSGQAIKTLRKSRKLTPTLSVLAPIDGVVLERMSTVGKRIDILEPLYRIANLNQLWLEIHIPHERINHISLGDSILIENSTATARISLLGQSVDPVNQSILARAVIEMTKTIDIRVGQTVNTRVVQTSNRPAYKVANVAIARSQGQAYIFVRTESGFIVEAVDILGKDGKNSIITGDLHGDENIAVRGAVALKAKWMELGATESKGHNH